MLHLVQHRVHPKVLERSIILENNIFCQISHWEHLENYICSCSKEIYVSTECSSEIENTFQDIECCVPLSEVENSPQYNQCSVNFLECKISPIDNEFSVTYTNMAGDCKQKIDLSTSTSRDSSINSQSCDTTCDVNDLYTEEGGRVETPLVLKENGNTLSTKNEVETAKIFSSSNLDNTWTLVKRRRNSIRLDNDSKSISKLSFQGSEVVIKKTKHVLPKDTSKPAALVSKAKLLRYPVSRFTIYSDQLLDKDISGLKAKDGRKLVSHLCIENETEVFKLQEYVGHLPPGSKKNFEQMQKDDRAHDRKCGRMEHYRENDLKDKKKDIKLCSPRQKSGYIPMKSSIGWNHGTLLLVLLLCVMAVQRSNSYDSLTGCKDKLTNCATNYADSACVAPYLKWVKDNCAKRCNLCDPCPTGFQLQSGICYKYFGSSAKTWQQARDACLALGAYLAEPSNSDENDAVGSLGDTVWLGATDSQTEGTWRWASDNSVVSWTGWKSTESTNGGTSENCMIMSLSEWTDYPCSNFYYYVCQYGARCARGWRRNGTFCYNVFAELEKWDNAKEDCKDQGAKLAQPMSPTENAAVLQMIKDIPYKDFGSSSYCWLGGDDVSKEGTWMYDDQEIVWSNWDSDSVLSANGIPSKNTQFNYLAMNMSSGKWEMAYDTVRGLPYVCQQHACPIGFQHRSGNCYKYVPKGKTWQHESSTTCDGLEPCTEGWRQHANKCYRLFGESVSQSTAVTKCAELGARLAMPKYQTIQDFLVWMDGRWAGKPHYGTWIGLDDRALGGQFKWLDGTPLAWVNWNGGEPNNGGGSEDCTVMLSSTQRWNDVSCNNGNKYLCERTRTAAYLEPRQVVEERSGENVLLDTFTDGGMWRIFQRRVAGDVNFYRNWQEYRNGFGKVSPTGDFWLGLEKIHAYCGNKAAKCELRIEMMYNSKCYRATYGHFWIDDEANKYRLHVADYWGNSGDSLAIYHNGMAFSTLDRDNDLASNMNCAEYYKAPWWQKTCFQSSLNGLWGSKKEKGRGMIWANDLTNIKGGVTFSEMKMRKAFSLFQFPNDAPHSYAVAEYVCESHSMKLPEPKDARTNRMLDDYLRTDDYVYLGMTKTSGIWRWNDGGSPVTWYSWQKGWKFADEPDHPATEHCAVQLGQWAVAHGGQSQNWADVSCFMDNIKSKQVICQDMTWGENAMSNGGMPDVSTLLVAVISVYYLSLVCMD